MAATRDTGMQSLGDIFAKYAPVPQVKPLNERAELVRYFFENASQDWVGLKPLTPRHVAVKLSHLTTFDLYAFKSMAEDRRKRGYPFGKFFWGALKAKS